MDILKIKNVKISVLNELESGKKYSFRLITGKKIYYFCAASVSIFMKWLTLLQNRDNWFSNSCITAAPPISIAETIKPKKAVSADTKKLVPTKKGHRRSLSAKFEVVDNINYVNLANPNPTPNPHPHPHHHFHSSVFASSNPNLPIERCKRSVSKTLSSPPDDNHPHPHHESILTRCTSSQSVKENDDSSHLSSASSSSSLSSHHPRTKIISQVNNIAAKHNQPSHHHPQPLNLNLDVVSENKIKFQFEEEGSKVAPKRYLNSPSHRERDSINRDKSDLLD